MEFFEVIRRNLQKLSWDLGSDCYSMKHWDVVVKGLNWYASSYGTIDTLEPYPGPV